MAGLFCNKNPTLMNWLFEVSKGQRDKNTEIFCNLTINTPAKMMDLKMFA